MKLRYGRADNTAVVAPSEPRRGFVAPSKNSPLLRLENICKSFPGTQALDSISLEVRSGEVHALFGENGAGKSTIIQIIAGVISPDSGSVFLNDEEVRIGSVQHARELGISAVYQEFSLIPQMSVEDNLFLGSEILVGPFLKKSNLHDRACEALHRLGFDLDPGSKVMYLSRAQQQMVEIAKAFRTKPSVMILDEPTASLTEQESNELYEMIDILKEEGIGVVYITHRINEIFRIADRITILRDGRKVNTVSASQVTEQKLVELAIGRKINQVFPKIKTHSGRILLNVRSLNLARNTAKNISLNIRAGEVVGLAGLVGSGKSEIGRACFGLGRINSGYVAYLDDVVFNSESRINDLSPRAMLDRGMLYLPSDRRYEGLVMVHNVRENVSLPSLNLSRFSSGLLLNRRGERSAVSHVAERLGLGSGSIERPLEHLSGGNQQKVLVAKSLVRDVKLFILDEPTVGVDVGARAAIYELIRDVCEAGAGVLLISSDNSEIVQLSHRAYVIHRGEMHVELDQQELDEHLLLKYLFENENRTYK